jgi:excisionase family DNA binding protein
MAKHIDTPPQFLTPAELSARWKITPMTLRRWCKAGKLKKSHFGRGVRFDIEAVERFEREAQG